MIFKYKDKKRMYIIIRTKCVINFTHIYVFWVQKGLGGKLGYPKVKTYHKPQPGLTVMLSASRVPNNEDC